MRKKGEREREKGALRLNEWDIVQSLGIVGCSLLGIVGHCFFPDRDLVAHQKRGMYFINVLLIKFYEFLLRM